MHLSKPIYFSFFWLIINLVQAACTELTSDEGYYWFYSRSLEWGYFEHPPLLTLLVKMGYALFPNEFGVRLFTVLLNALGVLLFFKIMPPDEKKQKIAFFIILSIPLFNYLSFIIFQDGPLLFFMSLYLYSYKRFIEKEDWKATLLMALSVTLMLYSKYHGLLVVILTVLIHLNLLRSFKFYAAMVLAFILFLPHLWWQYTHQFVTFKYHLQGRSSPLKIRYIFEYLSQQIIAIGPGLLIIPFLKKTKDRFERTMKFIATGTFIFFLLSSIRTFIHPHWTSIALYPLIYCCAVSYFPTKSRRLIYAFLALFALLVVFARLQLIFQIFPINHVGIDYYHGRDLWAADIKKLARRRPVFFGDNLRESSLYTFYSRELGVALQSGEIKRSQYELWHYEDSLQEKEVLLVQRHAFAGSRPMLTRMGKEIHYLIIPSFKSYFTIPIQLKFERRIPGKDNLMIETTIANNRATPLVFTENNTRNKPFLFFEIRKGETVILKDTLKTFTKDDILPAGTTRTFRTRISTTTLSKGKYILLAGFSNVPLHEAYNSKFYSFVID